MPHIKFSPSFGETMSSSRQSKNLITLCRNLLAYRLLYCQKHFPSNLRNLRNLRMFVASRLRLFLDLGAEAVLLLTEFRSELGAEVLSFEDLADLDL
jgi:hypothetical protein